MKKFAKAEIEEIKIEQTAFGPFNPNKEDSDKYQKVKPDGEKGWEQKFGEGELSSNAN